MNEKEYVAALKQVAMEFVGKKTSFRVGSLQFDSVEFLLKDDIYHVRAMVDSTVINVAFDCRGNLVDVGFPK